MLNAVIIVFIVFIAFVAFQTDGYKGEGLNAVFQVMVSFTEHIRHCVILDILILLTYTVSEMVIKWVLLYLSPQCACIR